MEQVVWRLRDQGRLLEIFKIDQRTRRITTVLPLKLMKPMTEAEAQKYIDDNHPIEKSSIRLAAETIDARKKT
jgi:hypothetical protein